MAASRRASMREGPLAALFRKTDEDAPAPAEAPHPSLASEEAAPAPAAPAPEAEVAVPSPQERLRAAFSSDIPDNILEPVTLPPREMYESQVPRRDPGLGLVALGLAEQRGERALVHARSVTPSSHERGPPSPAGDRTRRPSRPGRT